MSICSGNPWSVPGCVYCMRSVMLYWRGEYGQARNQQKSTSCFHLGKPFGRIPPVVKWQANEGSRSVNSGESDREFRSRARTQRQNCSARNSKLIPVNCLPHWANLGHALSAVPNPWNSGLCSRKLRNSTRQTAPVLTSTIRIHVSA